MPGPPPPPPPPTVSPPACPPMPVSNIIPSKGDPRGALLQSIRKGATLKKAATNDRSAPVVGANQSSTNSSSNSNKSSTISNGAGLGGLFAGGMPKLKPVGKQSGGVNIINSSNSNHNSLEKYNSNPSVNQVQSSSNLQRNFSYVQNDVQSALKKQMASNSNRNRGPPPPAPTRNISQSTEHLQIFVKEPYSVNGSSNGLHLSISSLNRPMSSPHQSPTSPNPGFSILQANSSTLHRKANSSANLTTYDITDSISNGLSASHTLRKPNLAPKPPVLNGKPAAPPKKLLVSGRPSSLYRAQSMKSPRTLSPQSPEEFNYASKFGTVRNMSAVLDKSLGQKMRPLISSRPTAPPPLAPSHQNLPHIPNKTSTVMKAPSHAPPPPPSVAPQPPVHAPPPPPQRGNYQTPVRTPPAVPSSSAPPPPPRHSSMRDSNGSRMSLDFDYKFRNEFHSISEFPQPGPYRALAKLYSNQESAC